MNVSMTTICGHHTIVLSRLKVGYLREATRLYPKVLCRHDRFFRSNIVITVKALPVTVRRIGNSLGIVIPKPVLAQVGLSEQAELTVERGAIVLRKPRRTARSGWAEAARSVATQGEDELLMGEFANAADLELEW
jgi:antitoxin MazE